MPSKLITSGSTQNTFLVYSMLVACVNSRDISRFSPKSMVLPSAVLTLPVVKNRVTSLSVKTVDMVTCSFQPPAPTETTLPPVPATDTACPIAEKEVCTALNCMLIFFCSSLSSLL